MPVSLTKPALVRTVSQLPSKPIPTDYHRVVLINPVKYLGNLLLAGGIIQQYQRWCTDNGIDLLVVLDESFRELVSGSLPEQQLLFYPRKSIHAGAVLSKLKHFSRCVGAIRRFKPDLAFNLEEDPVTDKLTRYAGARFTLGCSPARHKKAYDHVIRVDFSHGHRWDGYRQVFNAVGLPENRRRYMRLAVPEMPADQVAKIGLSGGMPFVIIHAGATKEYKRWPVERFISVCILLINQGKKVVLIGAGSADAALNKTITAKLEARGLSPSCINMCDRLSLLELAQLMRKAEVMLGNDSGPFHLASALRVPGVVIFGPTDVKLWSPLSRMCVVIHGGVHCDPACRRGACVNEQACLKSINPRFVEKQISKITNR